MAQNASDLVLASRLETEFLPGCVKHMLRVSGSSQTRVVEELWDVEPTIGRGTFGVVRFERLRLPSPSFRPPSARRFRAVKEINKIAALGKKWDYMKELEAIVKFSQPHYAPYFVQSYGWFENNDSIFISMEYFPLRDLRRFMDTRPPFSEDSTRQIARQLVEGIRFMHESGFAHRDLKPGNILVASDSPRWAVKIADFGISKQATEGGTHLRTMHIGTFGYMAPEVLGFFVGDNPAIAYSVSVDIWAIGVIIAELLLKKHPFPNVSDLVTYVHGNQLLNFDGLAWASLSEACYDFIRGLLAPDPATRPTANAAVTHTWLSEIADSEDDEESLFVSDDPIPQDSLFRGRDAATPAFTPASLPSLAWSNLQLTESSPATQSTVTLLNTYHGPTLDPGVLIPCFRGISLETTKYFVMRSDNPTDIETSIAHSNWTSSPRVNKIVDKAYTKTDGQVIMFFSVIKSQRFCGVARMTTAMDWENTIEHWMEDSWKGGFTLDWLCLTELPFQGVKTIPVSEKTPGFRAIACYDGTEIAATSAFELMKAFSAQEREQLSATVTPPATVTSLEAGNPQFSSTDVAMNM